MCMKHLGCYTHLNIVQFNAPSQCANCDGILRHIDSIGCGFARNAGHKHHFSTLLQGQRPNPNLISLLNCVDSAARMCYGTLTQVRFLMRLLEVSKSPTFAQCTHPSPYCPCFSYSARRKYKVKISVCQTTMTADGQAMVRH